MNLVYDEIEKESVFPYPERNEEGKVLCQICGKPFNVITGAHINKHNVSMEQYKERFKNVALSSTEFKTKQKYCKTNVFKKASDIIKPNDNDVIEDTEETLDFNRNTITEFEEIIVDEEPEIENLDIPNFKEDTRDPIKLKKQKILNILLEYFSNIKSDYFIRKLSLTNHLEYEYVSDFADPVLKVNIEFPNTFWHNNAGYNNPNRDIVLIRDGWKVININSRVPSTKDIRKAINNA